MTGVNGPAMSTLCRPSQTAALIEVLAELPRPHLGRPASLTRIPDKSHPSRILITCVYRESA